jgi:hypothetical protein
MYMFINNLVIPFVPYEDCDERTNAIFVHANNV